MACGSSSHEVIRRQLVVLAFIVSFLVFCGLTPWVASPSLALAAHGVSAWGANSAGQLGDGTTNDRSGPVSVADLDGTVISVAGGGGHSLAVDAASNVW